MSRAPQCLVLNRLSLPASMEESSPLTRLKRLLGRFVCLALAATLVQPGKAEVMPPNANAVARVFTESRAHPIRPAFGMEPAWLSQSQNGPPSFAGQAAPGEFFVFQIGIQALQNIGPLAVTFGDLAGDRGSIPARALRCLSLGGTNDEGRPFTKSITVPAGALQALWVGVDVPLSAQGVFAGTAQLRLNPALTEPVTIKLTVAGKPLLDHGDSVAKNLSRLRWLDSTVGSQPTLTAPFVPVQVRKRAVQVLGRELWLDPDGLPARIVSHFSPANTRIVRPGKEVLAEPMAFVVETKAGRVQWQNRFIGLRHSALEARWAAESRADGLRLSTTGRLDYTGSGEVAVHLTADRAVQLNDAFLETRVRHDAGQYFMGLGHQGGRCPDTVQWHWDTSKRQDCFWLGAVNAGFMLRFKDANYLRPPVNIYYRFRPLRLPESWGNGGRGGVALEHAHSGTVSIKAFCGPRRLRPGQSLDFIFELYLTPFRPLDTDKQWATRFIQPRPDKDPQSLDELIATADARKGPNVVNVHQAGYYNPYINYPYNDDSFAAFCDLVRRAHRRHLRVCAYYTTREITQNMPELLPLHSFNGELILPGPGKAARTVLNPNGPNPWLVANLGDNFVPAWVDKVGGKYAALDLSVCTTPDSRWNNFYLAGLEWMVRKSDFDGLYVDDTALNASSLRRARRILDTRPGRLISFHTWNHFNHLAGFANNLNIYMELLPYLDRLWMGEGFNASRTQPDYWLVSMSGLPFGLMSEMLDGVNPWRGMVFGETGRLGWAGDPREMWRVWDQYGIQGTEFCPFFLKDCPVKTGNPQVLATVYRKPGRAFIALGNWSDHDVPVRLEFHWKALGLNPRRTRLLAPAMHDFQPAREWNPGDTIPVPAGRGWFLVLESL